MTWCDPSLRTLWILPTWIAAGLPRRRVMHWVCSAPDATFTGPNFTVYDSPVTPLPVLALVLPPLPVLPVGVVSVVTEPQPAARSRPKESVVSLEDMGHLEGKKQQTYPPRTG